MRQSARWRIGWLVVLGALPALGEAHVKWFVAYDLSSPPRSVLSILSSYYFVRFCVVLAPLMFGIALADGYLTTRGCYLHRRAKIASERLSPYFPSMLRLGVSAFFAAVFAYGCVGNGMILTPELHTRSAWICEVQLAIALLVLWRATALYAGLGIVVLYAFAVVQFGIFHMLDYPIFLGVAAFLIVDSRYGDAGRAAAVAIVRIAAGGTLLWASIEKFAFPEWSFILLAQRPGMTLGFNPEFYMVAAGFVEFCAAYLLITGMLSARFAALTLLVMFVSAIVPFGRMDAIGHSVIIVVLVLLALAQNRVAAQLVVRDRIAVTAIVHTAAFFATLGVFVAVYYASYYLSYPVTGH